MFGTNGPIGYADEALSQGPKVIVGRKGAYRGVHLASGPFWVIDTAYYLSLAPEIDPRWAYYALLNSDINNLGSGSAIPSTTREDFYALPVLVPGEDEQKAVADVLSTIDDKIAANARVVRAADELSRACFQVAAVDGHETPLSSLARFVNGRAYTKDATGTGRVVVRIAELNSGIGASTVRNDIEVPDDNTARPGDLLFAWSGSLTAARWYRPEAIVNQHIFKVIPNDGMPMWLVNQAVHAKLDEFKAIAADKATTMGHIQRRHLDEPVRVPSEGDVKRLDELMNGLWAAALAAEIESLKLALTRDELLPLLMSGKVRVKDSEKLAEAVL
ncbi:restriction endonuclease subunit S [Nocardioides kribbensis]|uniref:Restriction endonuclease subunit S n=1 Tax=Nocardioides kribbensis TaxID=305517 RepID=A0ABV1NY97_9ACTN